MDVRSSTLTGAAGEHLVMSRLLSRGFIAALAPQGVLNFDIVVTSPDGAQLCAFQVKTSWDKGAARGWHMQEKHESISARSIFYALVDLKKNVDEAPTVYVVPSQVIADAVRTSYQTWLANPGKGGKKRNSTKLRRINFDYSSICGPNFHLKEDWLDEYKENWAQIVEFTSPSPTG